jgi:hypothetical protein
MRTFPFWTPSENGLVIVFAHVQFFLYFTIYYHRNHHYFLNYFYFYYDTRGRNHSTWTEYVSPRIQFYNHWRMYLFFFCLQFLLLPRQSSARTPELLATRTSCVMTVESAPSTDAVMEAKAFRPILTHRCWKTLLLGTVLFRFIRMRMLLFGPGERSSPKMGRIFYVLSHSSRDCRSWPSLRGGGGREFSRHLKCSFFHTQSWQVNKI